MSDYKILLLSCLVCVLALAFSLAAICINLYVIFTR